MKIVATSWIVVTLVLCILLVTEEVMSFRMVRYALKHKKVSLLSKPPFGPHRWLSTSRVSMIDKNEVDIGSTVVLKSGRIGIIKELAKAGWYSVAMTDTEETKKVRLSDFLPNASGNKDESNVIVMALDNTIVGTVKDATRADLPVITPPLAHQNCKSWVIFSDLHVKGASIDVCEQVLEQVHQAAADRNAGIIFLGDFWHVRGSLSVELLNRVLKALRKWEQPVIMIPGNHDQVTLGGKVHSLEPLLYAFRPGQIMMIHEPSVCLGALWVPYRRDPNIMRAVLQQGADTPGVSMIFCHADVKGAYMNDNMRSKEGLDISAFPKNIPIYSGHFHKPHTITKGGSTLRYVGSPYQTSLSEAGQDKFFYCVQRGPQDMKASENVNHNMELFGDSLNNTETPEVWREAERWVVNIGSKIIKAASPSDPSAQSAKPGDRVVVTVPVGQDYAAQQLLIELQARGVEVDLQHDNNPLTRRRNAIANASESSAETATSEELLGSSVADVNETGVVKVEEMNPLRIFDSYMDQLDTNSALAASLAAKTATDDLAALLLENSTVNEQLHVKVLEEGRSTLDRLLGSAQSDGSALGLGGSAGSSRVKELRVDKVTLSNFGPYGGNKAVEYPVASRGLVLIRGQSTDGTGADSNGAGKTTLAMSVMWGLTGSLDTRIVGDSKSADVAFDSVLSRVAAATTSSSTGKKSKTAAAQSKLTAEVVVKGTINNLPYEIIRRRSAKKAELHFAVNGTILTTQAVKDTQALIDEHLGIKDGLLQRCCFFGQHTHTMQSLLGLTDVKLKQELSALVDTSLWVAAGQDVRARERVIKTRLTELSVEARLRREELNRADNAFAEANSTLSALQMNLEQAQKRVEAVPVLNVSISDLTELLTAAQRNQEMYIKDTMEPLKNAVTAALQRRDSGIAALDKAINQCKVDVTKYRTEKNSTSFAITTLKKKMDQVLVQDADIAKKINLLQSNITSAMSTMPGQIDAAALDDAAVLRQLYEQSLADLTAVGIRIDTANTSLTRLRELNKTAPAHACTPGKSALGGSGPSRTPPVGPAVAAHDEECPTCGQEMPEESRAARAKDLAASLEVFKREKDVLSKRSVNLRKLYDSTVALKTTNDQKIALQDRIKELETELSAHTSTLASQSATFSELEGQLKQKESEKVIFLEDFNRLEGERLQEQKDANAHFTSLQAQEVRLRRQIDEFRLEQEQQSSAQSSAHAQVALAQDRVTNALAVLQEKTTTQARIHETLAQNATTSEDLTFQGLVLERLASVLGTRGIQNYVFQNVIEQLESITNAYLMVLAEGGIQLALQGDGEDEDRIVKSVWVRSKESGGEYRERSLAQLSGGQWRRVSLALDFAFAELIRRRGVLRSNLMVMDEVLTHLDASGRESVGTVLRAMVQGPGAFNTTTPTEGGSAASADAADSSVDQFGVALPSAEEQRMQQLTGALLGGGAYETVIVILQDLAAAELAEAFDHVDVVVKETDSSRVILDGADA